MTYTSATEHAKNLQRKEYTSSELLPRYYERIRVLNPKLNALVFVNDDQALKRAAELDAAREQMENPGPLYGVPVTIKESFKMAGTTTHLNYPPLKNYVADEDSVIVQRLHEAGAIILGKTNVPLLLSDAQTFGPLYPTCNNPYDLTRTPGGSTGGGACAVAAGLSTFEIGSDIGGSIRNPSSFCGLYGLKPTQNGHIQDGHIPPFPDSKHGFSAMNSTGPLARTMDDLALAYDVCYAPRWDYLQYLPVTLPDASSKDLSACKFAVYDSLWGLHAGEEVKAGLDKVCAALEAKGASVERIKIDDALAERILQNWVRLFGFVVGQDNPWLNRKVMKFLFNKDMKHSRIRAKKALSEGLSLDFKTFSYALHEQQETIAEFNNYFAHYDFVLSPTSVGPAFEHNHKHKAIMLDGEKIAYVDYCFLFVMMYNQLKNPVLTVPTGIGSSGLPVGISIAAAHHAEQNLIHLGKQLEQEGFVFQAPDLS